jgi:integrase
LCCPPTTSRRAVFSPRACGTSPLVTVSSTCASHPPASPAATATWRLAPRSDPSREPRAQTAAGQLDREARNDRPTPRRAILCTLTLAGLRIGELTALRWSDVDLAGSRLRIGEAKTHAGIREVRILPVLHDELSALKAKSQPEPYDLVFGTARGKQQSPSNIRRRVLDRSRERADQLLKEQKASPLPGRLTPHSLRRTFASLLFALGYSAPEVMEQLGHTDARLTLRIYAKATRQQAGERKRLRALVEGRPLRKNSKRGRARQISRTPERAPSSRSG